MSDEELETYYAEDSDEDLDLQDSLGGYINMSYEEWFEEIMSDADVFDEEEDWDDEDEEEE